MRSDAVWDSGVTRPCLTGQEEGVQQLRGCSRVVLGGSTSGTAGDRVGGRNWRRTDGNTPPSPVRDLYLESTCWCLLLLPCVTLVVMFLSEEFPILLHLLGQPVLSLSSPLATCSTFFLFHQFDTVTFYRAEQLFALDVV